MKQETQVLSDIAVKVGKLEALQETNTRAIGDMASSLDRLVTKLDQSDDLARDAMRSTKSAHHRLDRIEKTIFWVGTTVVGAVILAIIKTMMEGKM